MALTVMHSNELARQAETYLGHHLGVTRVLPVLWDQVMFEMEHLDHPPGASQWTKRTVARRYLDYLRDHTNRSAVDCCDD